MEFPDPSIVEPIEMKMIRPSQFALGDKFQKMISEIETLASSIREHGLLQPIPIRPLDHSPLFSDISTGCRLSSNRLKIYTLHHFLCDSMR